MYYMNKGALSNAGSLGAFWRGGGGGFVFSSLPSGGALGVGNMFQANRGTCAAVHHRDYYPPEDHGHRVCRRGVFGSIVGGIKSKPRQRDEKDSYR